MKAAIGDWLLVHSHVTGEPSRRAEIVGVGPDGSPPYRVRWTDRDHEVIVFPGPDAEIVQASRLAELDRQQTERIVAVQSSIAAAEPAVR
ncbi:MAG: DUF1918 domain-containing protein [Jatrophihabitans sp.]|nr:MAG: DUF1918 domain-containing protein [Jatrophihabitans sp.]